MRRNLNGDRPAGVEIRDATADDRLGVRRVLDAAMLDVRDDLGERIEAGDVLAASDARSPAGDRDVTPILGALVLVSEEESEGDAAHIDAVAVRRARRGRGIGAALVRAAAERRAPLTAEFDPGVRPFYDSLGFEISPVEGDEDRLRGHYGADQRA
jgi:GNAT superfamily N-acetyltransferase